MIREADRRIITYDVVRALAMLLVVFGHSSYYSVMTPFGGVDYMGQLISAGGTNPYIHDRLDYIVVGIYMFHMRVFFALSGAVFYLRFRQGAYRGGITFLQKKAQRLIVPFLLVTTFYVLPLKAVAGYWAGDANILRDILLGQYLLLGNSHLWFLIVMFFAFVILSACVFGSACARTWLCAPHALRVELSVMAILFALLFVDGAAYRLVTDILHVNVGNWQNCLWYAYAIGWGVLWMMIGILLERLRQRFAGVSLPMAVPAVLFLVMLAAFCVIYAYETHCVAPDSPLVDELLRTVLAVLGVSLCFSFGIWLSRTRAAGCRLIQVLSRDSMGIYLYSDPWNYVILALFASCFGIMGFGVPKLSVLLVSTRFVVTLAVGWGITLLLRRFSRVL